MKYNLGHIYNELIAIHASEVAFIYEEDQFTFAELDQRVNHNIVLLSTCKISRGDVLCIANTKTIETYSMMLACLKLGVAYVNLDIDNPEERLQRIINRCEPKALYEDSSSAQFKPFSEKNNLLHLNVDSVVEEKTLSQDSFDAVDGNTIAYIMFTSGSTGDPKGVAITHQNLIYFTQWVKERYNITISDNFANISPMYFDNSVFDFFGGLFNGASLSPIKKELLTNPLHLVKYIQEKECTIWFSVPSMLVYLLNMKVLRQGTLPSIRVFTFGGEGFPKPNLKKLYELYSDQARIINVYGPTEGTCICSSYDIKESDFENMEELASLGTINPNFSYLIENPNKEGIGELVIAGPSIGGGYYNFPEKTNQVFGVFDSGKLYMNRYYKTGDLVVEREGLLYFKGRKDNQIKHMGYRIELEEIENAISSFPRIQENAVIYHRVNISYGKIVAFVSSKETIEIAALKEHLKDKIPPYMIPNKFEIQDVDLPKNANGKVDRKTLKERYLA